MRPIQVLVLCATLAGCQQAPVATKPPASILIRNVAVVPMASEEVLPSRTVLVQNGRIAGIYEAGDAPSPQGAIVVDGTGKFLAPGLIDAHTHIPLRSDLERYLAHGVTSVREMWGLPRSLRWRDAVERGAIAGPHCVVSSTYFWRDGPPDTLHVEPTDAGTTRALVRQVKAEGYDLVKVVHLGDMETLKALVEEAHQQGLTVSGHYPDRSVPLDEMLALGMRSFEHLDEFASIAFPGGADEARMREVAGILSERNIALTTILTPPVKYLEIDRRGKAFYTPEAKLEILTSFGPYYLQSAKQTIDKVLAAGGKFVPQWIEGSALAKRAAAIFLDEGVTLALGTDGNGPFHPVGGVGIHDEMTLLREAGLTSYQILRAATVNGAKLLGRDDRTGQLREGFDADLLLLGGNPLENLDVLKNPEGVFVGGRYYSPRNLADLKSVY